MAEGGILIFYGVISIRRDRCLDNVFIRTIYHEK